MKMTLSLLIIGLLLLLVVGLQAQELGGAPCGVVDAVDLPIDRVILTYDDFGLFRPRFDGNHTGIDIGFDRWGDPVRAAARGQVTYSDVEGWDTEKGVIIVEHTFPDDSVYYSLYGHVEQSDTVFFPRVGTCVERGQVLAGIGWPSRGAPHLHYEVRDFLPNDGGPGYITGNPLDEGWYHPLDFTLLWRARLSPAYLGHATFGLVPTLPPVILDSGMIAIASGSIIEGVYPPSDLRWRVETDGLITGLAALPGDRVVARTRTGQTIMLTGGRYSALWTVNGVDEPFLALGELLIFITPGAGLAAYTPDGTPVWTLPDSGATKISHFATNGTEIAFGVGGSSGVSWRLLDAGGQITYETQFSSLAAAASQADGSWLVLEGANLWRITGGQRQQLTTVNLPSGRIVRLTVDVLGNSYLYVGGSDNTLLSLDSTGTLRWRESYPYPSASILPPLLAGEDGCVFYTLDADGMLNVFDSAQGALLNQMQLYAGGQQSGSPPARLLKSDTSGRVTFASGFLTLATMNGYQLAGKDPAECGTP